MIDRQFDEVAFTCDSCPDATDTFDKGEFNALVAHAKRKGWKVERVGGEWIHTCPDCREELALVKARKLFGKVS